MNITQPADTLSLLNRSYVCCKGGHKGKRITVIAASPDRETGERFILQTDTGEEWTIARETLERKFAVPSLQKCNCVILPSESEGEHPEQAASETAADPETSFHKEIDESRNSSNILGKSSVTISDLIVAAVNETPVPAIEEKFVSIKNLREETNTLTIGPAAATDIQQTLGNRDVQESFRW
jgi:hypothetical protein